MSLYEKIPQPTLVTREKRIVSIYPSENNDKSERLYSQNNQQSKLKESKNQSKINIHDDDGNDGQNST